MVKEVRRVPIVGEYVRIVAVIPYRDKAWGNYQVGDIVEVLKSGGCGTVYVKTPRKGNYLSQDGEMSKHNPYISLVDTPEYVVLEGYQPNRKDETMDTLEQLEQDARDIADRIQALQEEKFSWQRFFDGSIAVAFKNEFDTGAFLGFLQGSLPDLRWGSALHPTETGRCYSQIKICGNHIVSNEYNRIKNPIPYSPDMLKPIKKVRVFSKEKLWETYPDYKSPWVDECLNKEVVNGSCEGYGIDYEWTIEKYI